MGPVARLEPEVRLSATSTRYGAAATVSIDQTPDFAAINAGYLLIERALQRELRLHARALIERRASLRERLRLRAAVQRGISKA